MQEQIDSALGVLEGKVFWDAGRASDLEWFQFGAQETVKSPLGKVKVVGEYTLHVQCAWRITGPKGIEVASRDRNYPAVEHDEAKSSRSLSKEKWNRCDERMEKLIIRHAKKPLRVEHINANDDGSFRLKLTEGYSIDIFPDDSLEGEHWRLLQFKKEGKDFVYAGKGVERKEKQE